MCVLKDKYHEKIGEEKEEDNFQANAGEEV